MYKSKLSPKNARTASPKSAVGGKQLKLTRSGFSSPKSCSEKESDNLKKTIDILAEENSLLYEFKLTTVPKIAHLKLELEHTKNDLAKKENEIAKMKSFYESEISCMQDYINLLKNSSPISPENIQEELENEKARSMTFYRALMRKQTECEETHDSVENLKKLELEILNLNDQIRKLEKSEMEKNRDIEKLARKIKENEQQRLDRTHFMRSAEDYFESESKSLNNEYMTKTVIENLKGELKGRMTDCINKAVTNFNIFSSNINSLEDKLQKLEFTQKSIVAKTQKSRIMMENIEDMQATVENFKQSLDQMRKEKLEMQKKHEREIKSLTKDIKSYEDETDKYKKRMKNLMQDIENNKLTYENKLKCILKENNELKEKILQTEYEKDDKKRSKIYEDLLKEAKNNQDQLNSENSRLTATQKDLAKKLKDLEREKKSLLVDRNLLLEKEDEIDNLHIKIKDLEKQILEGKKAKNQLLEQMSLLQEQVKIASKKDFSVSTSVDTKCFSVDRSGNSILVVPESDKQAQKKLIVLESECRRLSDLLETHESHSIQLFSSNEELIEKDRKIESLKKQLSETSSKSSQNIESLNVNAK